MGLLPQKRMKMRGFIYVVDVEIYFMRCPRFIHVLTKFQVQIQLTGMISINFLSCHSDPRGRPELNTAPFYVFS